MKISTVLNPSLPSGIVKTSGEQLAATTAKPAGQAPPQTESTRVQLSAQGRSQSATAQSETVTGLQDKKNPDTAAANAAAARQQQGFSFNGVAAYSRVFSS